MLTSEAKSSPPPYCGACMLTPSPPPYCGACMLTPSPPPYCGACIETYSFVQKLEIIITS